MAPRPSAPFALTAPMLGRLLFACAAALPLSGCMDAAAATLATRLPVEPPEPKP